MAVTGVAAEVSAVKVETQTPTVSCTGAAVSSLSALPLARNGVVDFVRLYLSTICYSVEHASIERVPVVKARVVGMCYDTVVARIIGPRGPTRCHILPSNWSLDWPGCISTAIRRSSVAVPGWEAWHGVALPPPPGILALGRGANRVITLFTFRVASGRIFVSLRARRHHSRRDSCRWGENAK